MDILQRAFPVGSRDDAQILLILLVPLRGDVLHADLSLEQRFFDLIPDDDMEGVGEFGYVHFICTDIIVNTVPVVFIAVIVKH